MRSAYIDTSYLLAVALRQPNWQRLRTGLRAYGELVASNVLAAEFLSVLHREGLEETAVVASLDGVSFIFPDRSIEPELGRVLAKGHLRGADLWHVACACYYAGEPAHLDFLTRDQRQREVAAALGFRTP